VVTLIFDLLTLKWHKKLIVLFQISVHIQTLQFLQFLDCEPKCHVQMDSCVLTA